MRLSILFCLLLCATALAAADDDAKEARKWLSRALSQYDARDFDAAQKSIDKALALDKNNSQALQVRGYVHFMRGKFKESVADFDRHIALVPRAANGHWQRGISLYYAGKYADGMKQFNAYEKVSTTDVENGVWHFLCAAKKDGIAKARKGMLRIGTDERVPMMKVYALFAGKAKPADVLEEAKAGEVSDEQRNQQLFYAHLYLGLYYDITGEAKKAKEHLTLAASDKYRIKHYMGEVPRVHLAAMKAGEKKRD